MTKLLIILAVTIGLVLWFKRLGRAGRPPAPPKPDARPEDMVRCQVCGVHMPRSEAILSQGRTYCCDEHRQRDQA